MKNRLLKTKLCMPRPPHKAVSRPRLLERMLEGEKGLLTLICAPAGSGKTTLLRQWAEQSRLEVAWLSLDLNDNDPARFLSYLMGAVPGIATAFPDRSHHVPESLSSDSIEETLTAWINILMESDHEVALVLDNYEVIQNEASHATLLFLLEHCPSPLHLVIATRTTPPLLVARWRGQGQLTELNMDDLRFTTEEAGEFLKRSAGVKLDQTRIAALVARTEGWICGLRIAAVSLRTHDDIDITVGAINGSSRHIRDYLLQEVFQHQPEPVQQFLMQTSILKRLSAPICNAVMARDDGETMLETLQRANLFLIPLAEEPSWYRYHRLFADLLQNQLRQLPWEQVQGCHHRAGVWYEQHGFLPDAIEHALTSQNFARAADLIESVAEECLLNGDIASFLCWVDRLPDEHVMSRPSLSFLGTLVHLTRGRPPLEVESLIDASTAAQWMGTGPLDVVRAIMAIFKGQAETAAGLITGALSQLPKHAGLIRDIAGLSFGVTRLLTGHVTEGENALDAVVRDSRRNGNLMAAELALRHMAFLRWQQGKLYQAHTIYCRSLDLTTDPKGNRLPIAGTSLVGLGRLSLDWNRLEEAQAYLEEGLALTCSWSVVGRVDAHAMLARVKLARKEWQGAEQNFDRARVLARRFDVLDRIVTSLEVRLCLLRGDLASVGDWMEERFPQWNRGTSGLAGAASTPASETANITLLHLVGMHEQLALARVLLAQERVEHIPPLLLPLQSKLERLGLIHMALQARVLRTMALETLGQKPDALEALEGALTHAEPGGYIRVFLDEGIPMARLLSDGFATTHHPVYVEKLLAAFVEEGIDKPLTVRNSSAVDTEEPISCLTEPLSVRELEVLHLVARGLSNLEIAQRIFVSVSTIKWHTNHIYGKLGVGNRTKAVAKARALRLLPRV